MQQLTTQAYKQLIITGIQELPNELLAEAANFILFLRKQAADPHAFAEEAYANLINDELSQLDKHELQHLESELAEYDSSESHE